MRKSYPNIEYRKSPFGDYYVAYDAKGDVWHIKKVGGSWNCIKQFGKGMLLMYDTLGEISERLMQIGK